MFTDQIDLDEYRSVEELQHVAADVHDELVRMETTADGRPFTADARAKFVGLKKTRDEIASRIKELQSRHAVVAGHATQPSRIEGGIDSTVRSTVRALTGPARRATSPAGCPRRRPPCHRRPQRPLVGHMPATASSTSSGRDPGWRRWPPSQPLATRPSLSASEAVADLDDSDTPISARRGQLSYTVSALPSLSGRCRSAPARPVASRSRSSSTRVSC